MTKKNSTERFAEAFKGIEPDVWKVFEDPKEVQEAVDELSSRQDP